MLPQRRGAQALCAYTPTGDRGTRRTVLDRSKNRASVRRCALSADSPSVPSCPRRSPLWASWPRTCGGPGTRRRRSVFREVDPALWESTGRDPVKLLGAVGRARFDELAARRRLPGPPRCGAGRPGGVPLRRPLVPAPGRRRSRGHRVLLARVRHHRRAAAVLRRPGHPGRRPPQGRQRPGRADRRASACSTGTATSSSRSPARAGSRRPTRSSTPTGCRSHCSASRTARAPRSRSTCPAGRRSSRGSGWPASAGCRC